MKIFPSLGSYNLAINLLNVDFPEPDSPTIATKFPLSILKFIFEIMFGPASENLKETSLKVNFPEILRHWDI